MRCLTGKEKLVPMRDGHYVSRESDFIIYSVEAAFLDKVVAQYGPCKRISSSSLTHSRTESGRNIRTTATKVGSIVSGQTSVKAPERAAFEKYLPKDVNVVSIHSLHGPTVPPDGQALVSTSLLSTSTVDEEIAHVRV